MPIPSQVQPLPPSPLLAKTPTHPNRNPDPDPDPDHCSPRCRADTTAAAQRATCAPQSLLESLCACVHQPNPTCRPTTSLGRTIVNSWLGHPSVKQVDRNSPGIANVSHSTVSYYYPGPGTGLLSVFLSVCGLCYANRVASGPCEPVVVRLGATVQESVEGKEGR